MPIMSCLLTSLLISRPLPIALVHRMKMMIGEWLPFGCFNIGSTHWIWRTLRCSIFDGLRFSESNPNSVNGYMAAVDVIWLDMNRRILPSNWLPWDLFTKRCGSTYQLIDSNIWFCALRIVHTLLRCCKRVIKMWVLGRNWIRSDQEYRGINTSFSPYSFSWFLSQIPGNQDITQPTDLHTTCQQIPIVRTSQSSFVFVPRAEKQAVAKCASPVTISLSHHQLWCVISRDRVWYKPIRVSLPGPGRSLASGFPLDTLLGLNDSQGQPTNLQHRNLFHNNPYPLQPHNDLAIHTLTMSGLTSKWTCSCGHENKDSNPGRACNGCGVRFDVWLCLSHHAISSPIRNNSWH